MSILNFTQYDMHDKKLRTKNIFKTRQILFTLTELHACTYVIENFIR